MNITNNMKRIALAVSLLGCGVPSVVMAQDGSSTDGVYNPSAYILPSINLIDPDDKFGADRRGAGIGLRLGKPVSQNWDIQFGPTVSTAHKGSDYYRQATLGADALFLFSRGNWRPFILLGGGAEYDRTNRPNEEAAHTSPYINAGIGFQYVFGDQWGMQLDLRRAHNYIHSSEFNFDRANTSILTLGVTYAFEKSPAPAPVEQPTPVAEAPAAPPVPAPLPAPEPARFERYTLSSTELFGFDSAELSMPQPKLDEIADVLGRNTQVTNVVITGYTDRLGSAKYNMKLSQRRADAVKAYLVNKNVDANRLTAIGKGKSNPLVECTDKKRSVLIKCLEPNRRVEVEQIVIENKVQ